MKISNLLWFSVPAMVAGVFVSSVLAAAKSTGDADKSLPTPEEVAKMPPVVPEKAAELIKEVKVPAEFDATIFATPPAVNYPVFVAAAPDGTLYVSSDGNGSLGREPNRGRILRVRDFDGDGKADEVKVFVKNVDSPRGLVWDHDRVICLHPPHVSAFIDKNGDGIADEEKVLIKGIAFGFRDRPADHTSNGIELGVDGWIYAAIGDFGFMEAEGTDGRKLQLRGGGVVRFRPDGKGLQLFARGTRNILEVAVSPLLDIMTRDNTNDGGGWDVRFHHFTGFTDHGYPRLFKNFADEIITRLADYGGGSGCGAAWLDEPGIPAKWNNAPLTADWGRGWVYQHRPTPKGATFDVDQNEFIGVTRPTDADVDALGRIYVASWKGATFNWAGNDVGYLVRVTPKNFTPEPLPDFAKAGDAELVKLLESPSHRRRLEAQRTLIRRSHDYEWVVDRQIGTPVPHLPLPTPAGFNPFQALEDLAVDVKKPLASRVAAVFALKQALGEKSHAMLAKLAADSTIAAWAIRALADREDRLWGVAGDLLVNALKSNDARTRREAVVALGRWHGLTGVWADNDTPKPQTIRTTKLAEHSVALAQLLGDADPVVMHTATQVLRELKAGDACFAIVDKRDASAGQRAGALSVLQFIHDSKVVDGLIARLNKESDIARRKGLLTALCRLRNIEGQWTGNSWGTRPDTRGPYYQPEAWAATPRIDDALKQALANARGDEAAHLVAEFSRHRISPGDATGRVIELALKDATMIPAATAHLANVESVPAAAVPLLVKATESDVDLVSAQAVSALAKTDNADAIRAMLAALPKLKGAKGSGRETEQARDAFLNSPKLDNHHHLFEEIAAKLDGKQSVWAEAALVKIASRKGASPEAQEMANRGIDAGWGDPKRRAQIINAAGLAHTHFRVAQILAALQDPDKQVASAAANAVRALKIDPEKFKANTKDSGPQLATLKLEDVISAVMKTRGDVSVGEQLFSQQGCVNCHTVNPKDPPKGPFLGNIATIYKRRDLAENILTPNKTIAQGFTTWHFVMKDETEYDGFVTLEAADKVTIRNVAAQEITLAVKDIAKREKKETSLMPEGLVANLTLRQFAALLDYLEALAKK